jgi:hypothetical protein
MMSLISIDGKKRNNCIGCKMLLKKFHFDYLLYDEEEILNYAIVCYIDTFDVDFNRTCSFKGQISNDVNTDPTVKHKVESFVTLSINVYSILFNNLILEINK